MILLSGDAIINESMLTGESVPVSKHLVKDTELVAWRESGTITNEIAKSFLYSGTRIIRVRGSPALNGRAEIPAIALVARTGEFTFRLLCAHQTDLFSGFTTTKGSLVRSMLFPKPLGFAFYRDSMRFIGVLASIAGLGFMASAFQFVKLGVRSFF